MRIRRGKNGVCLLVEILVTTLDNAEVMPRTEHGINPYTSKTCAENPKTSVPVWTTYCPESGTLQALRLFDAFWIQGVYDRIRVADRRIPSIDLPSLIVPARTMSTATERGVG